MMRLFGILALAASLAGCVVAPPYGYAPGFYVWPSFYVWPFYGWPSFYGWPFYEWPGYYGYAPYGGAPHRFTGTHGKPAANPWVAGTGRWSLESG